VASFWTADEVSLAQDVTDWRERLTDDEKHFIKHVLAFFAGSDGIVMENLQLNFGVEVKLPEARQFYAYQAFNEAIHCVAPETRILTDAGYRRIAHLEDREVRVWNGDRWSLTTVRRTGTQQPLLTVHLDNGAEVQCTRGHKWILADGSRVTADSLRPGAQLCAYDLPVIDAPPDLEAPAFTRPYTHGVFCAAGSFDAAGRGVVVLHAPTKGLLPHLDVRSVWYHPDRYGVHCTVDVDQPYLAVPMGQPVVTKLRWLEGLCDAHGSLRVPHRDPAFLREVRLLLTTLGVHSRVFTTCDEGTEAIGNRQLACERCDVLEIPARSARRLASLGFSPRRVPVPVTPDEADVVCVARVLDEGRVDDTFCFNEPLRHAGIFNGVLTGQSQQYALLIDALVEDAAERERLFHAIENLPAVKKKADWALTWLNPTRRFAERLVAWICVEGILFSGSFCSIFWLKQRGLMPGLGLSNQFISRDEGLHQDFGTLLYHHLRHKLEPERIRAIVTEAVDNEKEFITGAIPCRLIGMNADLMSQYIEFVADRVLLSLGAPPVYGATNPFSWMELISLSGKDNFFEKFSSEYQKAGVMALAKDQQFALDESF
jgi:ribonucleotide reductase beta subunit family protein with ferritin-like domain